MSGGWTKLGALAFAAIMVMSVAGAPVTAGSDTGPADAAASAALTQEEAQDAAEAGVEAGISLAEDRGANVTEEQREAAVEGAVAAASNRSDRNASLIRAAAQGAAHGTLIQGQRANVSQVQATVRGTTAGALQRQAATVVQVRSAAYGASHGTVAGSGNATTEQLRRVANGSAGGATAMAVDRDTENVSMIAEAGQGAAYGALAGARNATVVQQQEVEAEQEQADGEQRQTVTVRQVQAAAFGAAEGAYDGNETTDAKQIRAAATGAAHGALVQTQEASVEQVQAATRGASRGALTQRQRVSVTQTQEAAYGAAKGSVSQYQEASVEQIQSAARGGASGVVQKQTVNVVQVQRAASGAASGAARTAAQEQIVDVRQIQAAAKGAGQGSLVQVQVVNVVQIQVIAEGASSGAVAGSQTANVVQIQSAARGAAGGATNLTQRQAVSVEQIQIVTERAASEAAESAAENDVTDQQQIADTANETVQREAEVDENDTDADEDDEIEPTADLSVADQTGDGTNLTVGEATANVEFVVEATADGETLNETEVAADETFEGNLTLDPPLEENDTVTITVRSDGTDEELASEEIEYTVEEEPAPPTATLDVENQTGNGTNLTVDEATANVEFTLEASENDTELNETTFDANGTFEGNLTLDPPLEENATVRVAVVDSETDETLNATNVTYNVTPDEEAEPEPEPEPETATLTFENQTSNGTSVAIDSVNSSNGTFVAVHETTATGEVGDVIGVSEFVDAGEAENVTVDLFDAPGLETDRTELTENATLVAMAHQDTDGDREFDFLASNGDDDGPYLNETGDPVVDDAFVTVADEEAPNETDVANETVDGENATGDEANGADAVDAEGPTASVEAADQTGNGTFLALDEATAGTEFYVNASANGTTYNETGTFDADESFSGDLALDPVLGENATVQVAVVDADTDETLNETNVSYTAAATPETADALAAYEDVETARDDGYVGTSAFDANESGTVGIRFVNEDLLGDDPDPRTPAILLYTINDSGEYELLGAEWYAAETAVDERPSLFDEAFDGPLPAHTGELEPHYGLYAWLFEDNPDGQFAQRNPAVDAPDLVTVADQTGNGSAVTVDRTVFGEEYSVEVRDEDGDSLGQSDTLGGEATELSVELDEPLTENSSVTVTLIDADTDAEIAEPVLRETVEYTVEADAEPADEPETTGPEDGPEPEVPTDTNDTTEPDPDGQNATDGAGPPDDGNGTDDTMETDGIDVTTEQPGETNATGEANGTNGENATATP